MQQHESPPSGHLVECMFGSSFCMCSCWVFAVFGLTVFLFMLDHVCKLKRAGAGLRLAGGTEPMAERAPGCWKPGETSSSPNRPRCDAAK